MSGWMKYPYLRCMDCPSNKDLKELGEKYSESENQEESNQNPMDYEAELDEISIMLVNHPYESCAWINGCTDKDVD